MGWVLLRNVENIDYNIPKKFDGHYSMYLDAYDYEKMFFALDPSIEKLRELKEEYITFNHTDYPTTEGATEDLDELIEKYKSSGMEIFEEFADTLERYHTPIVNSFHMSLKEGRAGTYYARLSNGPIESMNRKVKDLKRITRGFTNFEHFRNRLLFATRKNAPINGK